MTTRSKALHLQTAEDVMTRDLLVLPEQTPLREAVRKLRSEQVSGAPVVDGAGKCVGVFSTVDLLRLAERPGGLARPIGVARPLSCSFQKPDPDSPESDKPLCILPPGACPIQVMEHGLNHADKVICNQPHCVLVDWQTVEVEKLPEDDLKHFMTPDPITISPQTPLRDVARMMIDAHVHRLVVVNREQQPIGIVSSLDLVAVIARSSADADAAKGEAIQWMF